MNTPIDQEYATVDLAIIQGEDWERAFDMTDDTGTKVDFTGAAVQWVFAKGYDADAVVTLTSSPGGGITIAGTLVTARIPRAITKTMAGEYVHDLRVQFPSDARNFLVVGSAKVTRITKDNRA